MFWARWMRKIIKNVTMVVPVLMTSCHVFEKSKSGSVISHATMARTAREMGRN